MKRINPKNQLRVRGNVSGFTLMEMLLGLCMFSILSVCVFSTYSAGMKINRKAATYNQFYREINLSVFEMCREMENQVNYNLENSYPEKASFIGAKDSVAFLLATDQGLKIVRYSLIPARSSHLYKILVGQTSRKNIAVTNTTRRVLGEDYLVREEKDFVAFLQEGLEGEWNSMVVSTNIKSGGLEFSYGIKSKDSTEGYVWQEEWESQGAPQSVKMKIEYYIEGKQQKTKMITKDIFIPTGIQLEKKG